MNYQTHSFINYFKLSQKAESKITELLNDETEVKAVRVYVSGGGCSGMSYSMSFAKEKNDNDLEFTQNGAVLYIDPIAVPLLSEVEVDFKDDELSSSFVFNNSFNMIGGSGGCKSCGSSQG